MTLRWGLIGPGRMAHRAVPDFVHVPDAEVVAVASRSKERALAFAAAYEIPIAHDSYAALIEDDAVDVVYIATPHPQHRAVALAAVRAGKPVLVEKSFTVSPAATREIIDEARRSGTFVMEGMWTRFQPATRTLRRMLREGAIGEPVSVQADLGSPMPVDPNDRFYDPARGGGALFDLMVYLVSFAQMVLGEPVGVHARGLLTSTGVDVEESVLLDFAGGRTATLFASLRTASPASARVFGTEGCIDVLPRFHHPVEFVVRRPGRDPLVVTEPPRGAGFSHEFAEVGACLEAGLTESPALPLADTVVVQDVLDRIAAQLGVQVVEGPSSL